MASECAFCKIVQGELPAHKVFEDPQTLAFLDLNPITPGHVLVIPKEHHEWLLDLPIQIQGPLLETVQRVARAILKATNAQGFNVGMNNGRVAGQIVFHAHFHIIPRYAGDRLTHWPGHSGDERSLKDLCEKIAAAMEKR